MKEKVSQAGKKLAHPKWKAFFDGLIWLGIMMFLAKLVAVGLDKFMDIDLLRAVAPSLKTGLKFLPFALMVVGAVGSDSLKHQYAD